MRLSAIIFLILLCRVQPVHSDDLMDEALKNCDKNQLTLNYCASHFFDLADKELNDLFKQKMATLESAKTKKYFRDAQRAWVLFRDKDCLYQVPTRDGSRTDWTMLYWACMKIHTQQRAIEIKEYISCTSDDCPR